MECNHKLYIRRQSFLDGSFTKLFDLNVGDVFQIVGDYEAVMLNIEKFTPAELIFEVFPITPGTSLFTMYGPDHCVVTKKEFRK